MNQTDCAFGGELKEDCVLKRHKPVHSNGDLENLPAKPLVDRNTQFPRCINAAPKMKFINSCQRLVWYGFNGIFSPLGNVEEHF